VVPITPAGETAVIFLHDSLADPESQAGALGGFGAEEGLEQSLRIFGADADPGIENGD
jgi:hypothetical protein